MGLDNGFVCQLLALHLLLRETHNFMGVPLSYVKMKDLTPIIFRAYSHSSSPATL
jgi:hypothetical protein